VWGCSARCREQTDADMCAFALPYICYVVLPLAGRALAAASPGSRGGPARGTAPRARCRRGRCLWRCWSAASAAAPAAAGAGPSSARARARGTPARTARTAARRALSRTAQYMQTTLPSACPWRPSWPLCRARQGFFLAVSGTGRRARRLPQITHACGGAKPRSTQGRTGLKLQQRGPEQLERSNGARNILTHICARVVFTLHVRFAGHLYAGLA